MAIKGNAYTKTSWSFQERPVASSKLNLWDDRIESALELAFFLLSQAWGGGNGVVRGATANDLKTLALSPPALAVEVQAGYAFIGKFPFKLASATQTVDIVPPATHSRIDLVQARLDTWTIAVKTGTEAASPSPPSADEDCLALARLYLRPGMTCIKDADDGMNGYVADARVFV